jgi:LCP family protein required for cell wall assembly
VRSFFFRFAVAFVVVSVLAAAGVFLADWFARKEFEQSRKVHVPNLVRAEPGQPANYLLIGSDTREGTNAEFGGQEQAPGKRSDVMMVLHVDPASRNGMLVSFPRDLVVNIPGHGRQLLNAAYELGGADGPGLVIQTLQENFPPLRINHYIEVDFKGFEAIVDAIGKIHLWFPTPAHDPYSGLNMEQSGCVTADGGVALAYARSRHYYVPEDTDDPAPWEWNYSPELPEDAFRGGRGWVATGSDLDRIPRQQYFLRTVSQAAIDKAAANPTKLIALLDELSDHFTRDDTLKYGELKALIRTYNRLDPRRVEMITLPVAQAPYPGFSQNLVATDEASAVIGRLMLFGTTPPVPEKLPPARVKVRVVNGTEVAGAADPVIAQFRAAGFDVLEGAGEADRTDYARTQLRYAPGRWAEGYTVATAVSSLNLVAAISEENTLGAHVLVVVGRDYDSLPHEFPVPAGASTTAPAASPTTVAPATTTPTTAPDTPNVDSRFVPVDPEGRGPLVGCPT